jgi:hypothetical protein
MNAPAIDLHSPEAKAILDAAKTRRPTMGRIDCPWCAQVGRKSDLFFAVDRSECWTLACDGCGAELTSEPLEALPRGNWLNRSLPPEAS